MLWPAMEQQHGIPFARLRDVHPQPAGRDKTVIYAGDSGHRT
jgi:hypothetical protein